MPYCVRKIAVAAGLAVTLPNLAAGAVLTSLAEMPVGAVALPEAQMKLHQTDGNALGPDFGLDGMNGGQHTWVSGISYDWSYSYSGGNVIFTLAGVSVGQAVSMTDPGAGIFGSLQNLEAPGKGNNLPDDLTMMFSINWVNGEATSLSTFTLNQGDTTDFLYGADLGDVFTISGTVSASWSGGLDHSPNERFSLALGAFSAPGETFWGSDSVPAPAGAGIIGVALAALAGLRRRTPKLS